MIVKLNGHVLKNTEQHAYDIEHQTKETAKVYATGGLIAFSFLAQSINLDINTPLAWLCDPIAKKIVEYLNIPSSDLLLLEGGAELGIISGILEGVIVLSACCFAGSIYGYVKGDLIGIGKNAKDIISERESD